MKYLFTRDITVEGVPYSVGDVVSADQLPEGSMVCLRGGFIKPFEESETPVLEPQPEPVSEPVNAEPEAVPDPPQSAKKKGK